MGNKTSNTYAREIIGALVRNNLFYGRVYCEIQDRLERIPLEEREQVKIEIKKIFKIIAVFEKDFKIF